MEQYRALYAQNNKFQPETSSNQQIQAPSHLENAQSHPIARQTTSHLTRLSQYNNEINL
jgi:hypothetical protein